MHSNYRSVRLALAAVALMWLGARGEGLKQDLQAYFDNLRQSFSKIAASSAVRSTRLRTTDRYFVKALKKHQTIHVLLRTNSKGVVISEVIRGKAPEREYRNIARQQWFTYVARNNRLYDGLLKEEGRYYAFWAEPVIHTARSGRKQFVGAAAAKVDLWDCFHKLSAGTETPFLVRLNGKSLYSHKWKRGMEFREERLDIPGVDRISIRYVEGGLLRAGADTAVRAPQSQVQAEPPAARAQAGKKGFKLRIKGYTFPIIVGAVMLLALIFALVRLIVWIRYKSLAHRIDKESML